MLWPTPDIDVSHAESSCPVLQPPPRVHLHDAVVACHLHACVHIRHGARTDVTVATSTVDPAVSQFAAGHDERHRTRTAAEWGKYGAP